MRSLLVAVGLVLLLLAAVPALAAFGLRLAWEEVPPPPDAAGGPPASWAPLRGTSPLAIHLLDPPNPRLPLTDAVPGWDAPTWTCPSEAQEEQGLRL